MEIKYAIQCLDVLSKNRMTSRQKEAWQTVKEVLVQQPITQQGSEPSEILQHLENAKKLCAEGLSECAISSIDKAAKLLPC